MKALTYRQARACEQSTSRRCRCRCAGAHHGAGRGELYALPAGDLHAIAVRDTKPAAGRQLTLFDLEDLPTPAPAAAVDLIPVAAGRDTDPGQLALWSSARTHLERARAALADRLAAENARAWQTPRDVLQRRLAARGRVAS